MKLIDVIGNGQENTLGQCILFSPIKVTAEVHIFFYHGKTAFRLNAPVHPQLCPILRRDPFQCFLPFLFHHFGDTQPLVPFLHRCPAVIAVDTFVFTGTSFTAFAFIDSHGTDVAILIFTMPVINPLKLLSLGTGIFICPGIISHVFSAADILTVFPGPGELIILWLQIGFLAVLFQENISFFAFISGIHASA